MFKRTCNTGQNFCSVSHVLAQFSFTKIETELNYFLQRQKVYLVSRVAEWILRLSILGNWKLSRYLKGLEFMENTQPATIYILQNPFNTPWTYLMGLYSGGLYGGPIFGRKNTSICNLLNLLFFSCSIKHVFRHFHVVEDVKYVQS